LVEAIHEKDPDRLIIADGLQWGTEPVPGLAGLKIAQSTRGYDPFQFTHYKASWVKGSDHWPEPEWPFKDPGGQVWDKARLRQKRIEPWKVLERWGVGIHVGEWGAHQHTPHKGGSRLDARQLESVEGGGVGLGAVELSGQLRRPR
jgi:endoglucanase